MISVPPVLTGLLPSVAGNLQRLARGFSQYSKSTSAAAGGTDEAALWQGAELLLAPEGNVLQQVLVDEAAAALSGFAKAALANTLRPPKRPTLPLNVAPPTAMPSQRVAPAGSGAIVFIVSESNTPK